ncbi:Uncharacterised protein [uncultured archaeon]|nr:Uncharacterised protein [uncultured archaeon]
MRDKRNPYDLNDYRPMQLRPNLYGLSSSTQSSSPSQPKCKLKEEQPKTYFCPYTGSSVSGVAARHCNYSNLDDFTCSHTGDACVAKGGLEEFAQSQAKCTTPLILARSQGRKIYETPRGTDWPC